jgi:hypothetical protein
VFQSYRSTYYSFDPLTDLHTYRVEVRDTEFEEELLISQKRGLLGFGAAVVALIQVYRKRNCTDNQIAKELWRLFEFRVGVAGWGMSINEQIKDCLGNIPEYRPYHSDIQMLLLFS